MLIRPDTYPTTILQKVKERTHDNFPQEEYVRAESGELFRYYKTITKQQQQQQQQKTTTNKQTNKKTKLLRMPAFETILKYAFLNIISNIITKNIFSSNRYSQYRVCF